MERRRIPSERERWLSAVLIVTAIAGASVVVPRWPVAVALAPPAVPRVSARSLPSLDVPDLPRVPTRVPMPVSLSRGRPAAPAASHAPVTVEAPVVAALAATGVARPTVPVSPTSTAVAAGGEVGEERALLASRRVDLAGIFHPLTEDDLLASSSSSHGFVEMPAVAVTRAVMVAGRGIRTGLRATGAVFRAAF